MTADPLLRGSVNSVLGGALEVAKDVGTFPDCAYRPQIVLRFSEIPGELGAEMPRRAAPSSWEQENKKNRHLGIECQSEVAEIREKVRHHGIDSQSGVAGSNGARPLCIRFFGVHACAAGQSFAPQGKILKIGVFFRGNPLGNPLGCGGRRKHGIPGNPSETWFFISPGGKKLKKFPPRAGKNQPKTGKSAKNGNGARPLFQKTFKR